MTGNGLKIQRIDTSRDDARQGIAELRRRLSPQGNVVREAGRKRTMAVFGRSSRALGVSTPASSCCWKRARSVAKTSENPEMALRP